MIEKARRMGLEFQTVESKAKSSFHSTVSVAKWFLFFCNFVWVNHGVSLNSLFIIPISKQTVWRWCLVSIWIVCFLYHYILCHCILVHICQLLFISVVHISLHMLNYKCTPEISFSAWKLNDVFFSFCMLSWSRSEWCMLWMRHAHLMKYIAYASTEGGKS